MMTQNGSQVYKSPNKPPRWFAWLSIALAIGLLLLASFLAWRDEYKKTRPGLQLVVQTFMSGQAHNESGNDITAVVLLASLSNVGQPSIADQWILTISFPDGRNPIVATPSALIGESTLHLPVANVANRQSVDYNAKDALYDKTASVPISQGGRQTGFLLFEVSGLTQAEAETPGMIYTVSCHDVFGNTIVGSFKKRAGMDNSIKYLPGMDPPVVK